MLACPAVTVALRRVSAGGHGEQHADRPPVSFFELAVARHLTLPPHHPTNIKL